MQVPAPNHFLVLPIGLTRSLYRLGGACVTTPDLGRAFSTVAARSATLRNATRQEQAVLWPHFGTDTRLTHWLVIFRVRLE